MRPAVELEVVEVCASAEGPAWGREGFADRDKEVTMKEKTLGTKLLLAAVTLGVLAYFSIQAVRYFGDPLTTTIATSIRWRCPRCCPAMWCGTRRS